MTTKRKYPAGIQSFERIRRGGYVYVDKTPLIYEMVSQGGPYFLSRPRRFGKSLLVSTLAAIYEGKRELFESFTTEEGICQPQLFIARTNWRWTKHPVFRFDFSAGDLRDIEELDTLIDETLKGYEQMYHITPGVADTNIRMRNLLRISHEQSGQCAVVLVDEYDNFILHALGDKRRMEMARQRFQNLFGPLKEMDEHLEFVLVTGISRFSQMGIFSKLNQLLNISMVPMYDAICGISEDELTTYMREDIECLGQERGESYAETLCELKAKYDGYHFSERQTDIYNPYSLVNVFKTRKMGNYWFDQGTSGALIDTLAQMPPIDISEMDGVSLPVTAFDLPLDSFSDPIPVLYQTGYLTIKDYSAHRDLYTLGFPNAEVRTGFADCLYRHVTGTRPSSATRSAFLKAYYDFLDSDDFPQFMKSIKTFFASLPYQMEQHNENEHHYHALLYMLLLAFGADVHAEESSAMGRSDIVLKMPSSIYVMELKYDSTASEALRQIDERGYAEKYRLDGRQVMKVGVAFSSKQRNIVDWKSEKLT